MSALSKTVALPVSMRSSNPPEVAAVAVKLAVNTRAPRTLKRLVRGAALKGLGGRLCADINLTYPERARSTTYFGC